MKKQIIELDGKKISYTIITSKRARNPFIKIDAEIGLALVKPYGMRLNNVSEIMECKASWILKKLKKYNLVNNSGRQHVKDGDSFDLLGTSYRINIGATAKHRPSVIRKEGDINIFLSENGNDSPSELLKKWCKKMAREIISSQVQIHAATMDVKYSRISIRDQKTRWGSCSSRKNLSFNWRIIMAPLEIVDYLIFHELCHLIELNHSKKFWAHMSYFCPDFKKRKKWLRIEGLRLRTQI